MMPVIEKADVIKPTFIGGTQRSGTSLLRALIDSNSEIYFPQAEMKFFVRYYRRLKEYEPIDKNNLKRFLVDYGTYRKPIEKFGLLDDETFFGELYDSSKSWADIYNKIVTILASGEGKKRWGEKSPVNEFFTDQILEFYPNAKIICTIRNPFAVIASSRRRYKKGFVRPTIRWKLSVQKIVHDYLRLPKDSFHIVFYEDLILDVEETMKGVFDFLEIEPDDSVNNLSINQDKWGYGGTTSYGEKELSKVGVLWKHTLSAYFEELSPIELKVIQILSKKEMDVTGYSHDISSLYNQFFIEHVNSSQKIPKYKPLRSLILNRITDRAFIAHL